ESWSVTKNGNSFASGSGTTFSFTPDDDGSYVVTFTATDKDSGTGTSSATIVVFNVPPTVSITGVPVTSVEGTTVSLGSTVNDPSPVDQAAGFTKTWSVTRDGSPFASGSGANFTLGLVDEGTYAVTFSATDKDGDTGTASATISVGDAALSAAGHDIAANAGASTGLITVATFTDLGGPEATSDYSATISWGDSTTTAGSISLANGLFSVQGNHTYSTPGNYSVAVSIAHENGITASTTSTATI